MKVKAGALYYTVLISFIISALIGFFVLSTLYYNRNLESLIQKEKVKLDVNSAITLLTGEPKYLNSGEKKIIDLYSQGTNQVDCEKLAWGLFHILKASSYWKDYRYQKTALIGDDIFIDESIGLYLADQGSYISVSGNSLLSGTCYLPKLGIRAASIEGQGYKQDKLVFGSIKTSSKNLPGLLSDLLSQSHSYLGLNNEKTDSIISVFELNRWDTIRRSFLQPTILVHSNQPIVLKNIVISGNVKIFSEKEIIIEPSASLEDIIVSAPVITFKSQVSGTIQCFATRQIKIGEECSLKFPSVLVLIPGPALEENSKSSIEISKSAKISGIIINESQRKDAQILLGQNSKIYGQVYCNGSVELKGDVIGTLYCQHTFLKTSRSLYINHILNSRVDFSSLSKQYVGRNLSHHSSQQKVIKWLF